MDRRTILQTDKWTEKQFDRLIGRLTHGKQTDSQTDRWEFVRMVRYTDGRINRLTAIQMDRHTDRLKNRW
jgi:hypothetical protein